MCTSAVPGAGDYVKNNLEKIWAVIAVGWRKKM
jgi:hypothetical protein